MESQSVPTSLYLELHLQRVDLCDADVPLLVDQVHLGLQDPPLALGVTQTVRDLLVLVALREARQDFSLLAQKNYK